MDEEPAPIYVGSYTHSTKLGKVGNIRQNRVVGICFITLLALSTVVNSAIIVYFLVKKIYKLSHHMAYLNLAVADLCICIYGTAFRGPAIYGIVLSSAICTISAYTGAFVTMVNFASILPITYDRLVAVVFPYRYKDKNHRGHLKFVIALIWTTPIAVLSLITLYAYAHNLTFAVYFLDNNVCLYDDWGKIYFIWFLSCCFYIMPLLFNVISYSFIIKELRQKRASSRTLLISLRAILICVVFTVSWVPHFTFHMIGLADDNEVMWISQVFMYLNAISDPLLYLFSLKAITPCIEKIRETGKRGITITSPSISTVSPVPLRMLASTRRVLPDLPTKSTNG